MRIEHPARWRTAPDSTRVQWYRGGRPIPGATGRRYRIRPADVRERLSVRVTGVRAGAAEVQVSSRRTRPVAYRVPVRRVVSYEVRTIGAIAADIGAFQREVQETFEDPRGWRAKGVRFRRVRSGGAATLVLAAAPSVPRFAGCSEAWSCRAGRYVVINQRRWRSASPSWNAAGGSLRNYRHMVVNHEAGHLLGYGHAGCAGAQRPAPVMMQQSISLGGCRFNPWPLRSELRG